MFRDGPPRDEEEEEEEDEFGPGSADYDLSEAHGYTWEPERREWPVPSWAMIAIALLVVVALVAPALIIVLRDT
jgi:hypothetical protein